MGVSILHREDSFSSAPRRGGCVLHVWALESSWWGGASFYRPWGALRFCGGHWGAMVGEGRRVMPWT